MLKKLASFLLCSIPSIALATNGYVSHGFGAASKALAGVGTAFSQDTLSPATNPAGLVRVDRTFDVDLAYFAPFLRYDVTGELFTGNTLAPGVAFPLAKGSFKSNRSGFVIPAIGYKRQICPKLALGLTLVGNGGMNTAWQGDNMGTFYAGRTGVDYAQGFVLGTVSYAFSDQLSFGISPIFMLHRLKFDGLQSFMGFSNEPEKLSNMGHETCIGTGLRVGFQYRPFCHLQFGASYQTTGNMKRFKKYSGIIADHGKFDIASNGNIGVAWWLDPRAIIEFNVQQIWYNDTEVVHNPLLPNFIDHKLGMPGASGFGWESMTVYKLGMQLEPNDILTLRLGLSYGAQPIPESEVLFNIIAPGVIEWHITAGFEVKLSNGGAFKMAAMYAPTKKIEGLNPLDLGQNVQLRMYQYELTIGYAR